MKRWIGRFTAQLVHIMFICVLVLTLRSCGGDGGNSSPFGSISGNYAGTLQDSIAGAGTVQGTLSESGSSLSGMFQTTFTQSGRTVTGSGTVSGTVNGTSITLTLTPSDPTACPFNITLTQVSDTQLTGTYTAFNCTVAQSGTINVTRQ